VQKGRQTIVVAGILLRDGKILIGQRKAADRHGLKWEFPGGKLERGETPREALIRELKEELEIDAVAGPEVARYEHAPPGRAPLLLIFHRVASFQGEPTSAEFQEIRWEDPANLDEYDFLDGDLDLVRRLALGRIKL
jgi:8-oxo-dGTP diphosphatase